MKTLKAQQVNLSDVLLETFMRMTGRLIPITRKQVEAFEAMKEKKDALPDEIPDASEVLAEGYRAYGKSPKAESAPQKKDPEEIRLSIAARNGKSMSPETINKITEVVKNHLRNEPKSE